MKFPRRMTRVATIVGATALLAANLGASVANANGGGVGEPTVASDDYRTVSSIGNYALVRGPGGTRVVTYQCNTLATGDVAATTVNCSLQLSGSQISGGSITLSGPTAEYPGTATINQSGSIRLCYSGSGLFILPTKTLTNDPICTKHNVDIP